MLDLRSTVPYTLHGSTCKDYPLCADQSACIVPSNILRSLQRGKCKTACCNTFPQSQASCACNHITEKDAPQCLPAGQSGTLLRFSRLTLPKSGRYVDR